MLHPEVIELLRREIADVRVVYVFGSTAEGLARPDSDVDIAVLADNRLEPTRRWEIQEQVATLLHRDVDLVDLRSASSVLRMQVLSNGVVAFEAQGAERALFEATALSDYVRLNEERRGILDDVRARGGVHG